MDQILKLEVNVRTDSDGSECSSDHGKKRRNRAPAVVIVEQSESSHQSTESLSEAGNESHRWANIEKRQKKREMELEAKKKEYNKPKGFSPVPPQQKRGYKKIMRVRAAKNALP